MAEKKRERERERALSLGEKGSLLFDGYRQLGRERGRERGREMRRRKEDTLFVSSLLQSFVSKKAKRTNMC
jgi:hypothetical protein